MVTHHRVFDPPSTVDEALEALDAFLEPPAVRVLSETPAHHEILCQVLRETPVNGNLIHDAHLVALALEHSVHEIVKTGDAHLFLADSFAPSSLVKGAEIGERPRFSHRAFTGDLTSKWRGAHMKELLAEMHMQSRYLDAMEAKT